MDFVRNLLGSRPFWIVFLLGLAVLLVYLFAFRWTPATQIKLRQMALVSAVEHNTRPKLEQLISESYSDQWGLSRQDLLDGCRELRQCFITMEIFPEDVVVDTAKGEGTFSARMRVEGIGQGAELIKMEASRLKAPFVMTWRKEGPMPWDWRLVNMSNEELKALEGYRPGTLTF